jgi:transposase
MRSPRFGFTKPDAPVVRAGFGFQWTPRSQKFQGTPAGWNLKTLNRHIEAERTRAGTSRRPVPAMREVGSGAVERTERRCTPCLGILAGRSRRYWR